MSSLIILSHRGDDRLEWNVNDPNSVMVACSKFLELKKAGYLLFKVVEDEEVVVEDFDQNLSSFSYREVFKSGEQLHEFEPKATAIVAAPPLVGG